MEDFLRPDEDVIEEGGAHCGAALGAGRLSSKSLASDSTAVRFNFTAQQPAQHAQLTSQALAAAATPEVSRNFSLLGRAVSASDTSGCLCPFCQQQGDDQSLPSTKHWSASFSIALHGTCSSLSCLC